MILGGLGVPAAPPSSAADAQASVTSDLVGNDNVGTSSVNPLSQSLRRLRRAPKTLRRGKGRLDLLQLPPKMCSLRLLCLGTLFAPMQRVDTAGPANQD